MPKQIFPPVRLRKFPFPYKAAFTVCSDIDGTSFENFLEIHRFLNGNQETSLGKGLGLEIGDSFWFYSKPGCPDHAFAYFDDTTGQQPSAHAEIMREFLRAGFLDVMHTYGNFSRITHGGEEAAGRETERHFTRALAEKALNELAKIGVTMRTWVNHGGPTNSQNIGAKLPGALGDCPRLANNMENSAYHTDLLIESGARFFWEAENAVTNIIGQDRPCTFTEAYLTNVAFNDFSERLKNGVKGLGALGNRFTKKVFDRQWFPFEAFLGDNDLLQPWMLRDGNRVFKFRRYGSGRWDWGDDVPHVLGEKILDHLIDVEGASILYVHLGDRRDRSDGLPLSKETVEVFKTLARKFYEGKIWVTTISRLLTYCAIRDALRWHYEPSGDQHFIYIDGLDSEIIGRDWLTAENLRGLAFETPEPEKTQVVFRNTFLPIERNNPMEESVSLPIEKPRFPPV